MSIHKSIIVATDPAGNCVNLVKLDEFQPANRDTPAHTVTVIYTESGDLVTPMNDGTFRVVANGDILKTQ